MSIYGHLFPKHSLVGLPVGRDDRTSREVAVALHRDYNEDPTQSLTGLSRKYGLDIRVVTNILLGVEHDKW